MITTSITYYDMEIYIQKAYIEPKNNQLPMERERREEGERDNVEI
jgi:hypothetical protein